MTRELRNFLIFFVLLMSVVNIYICSIIKIHNNNQFEAYPSDDIAPNDDDAKTTTLTKDSNFKQQSIHKQSSHTKISGESCLSNASLHWLEENRYGNVPSNFTLPVGFPLQGPLLGERNLQLLLEQQSLCQRGCPFISLGKNAVDNFSEEIIHIWRVRLIYISIYYHQHRHAIQETKMRERGQPKQCKNAMENYNVGTFDFECRESKFLVSDVSNVGIGSLLKWNMVNMMMSALAMNRTLVLYSNIEINGTVIANPWELSSCNRKDLQCSFQPITGCVLKIDDIIHAKDVKFEVFRNFLYSRNPSEAFPYNDERVIRFNNKAPIPVTQRTLKALNEIASSLIDELDVHDERIPILRKASHAILQDSDSHGGGTFTHSDSDFVHAFIMYALRPITNKGVTLENFFHRDLPQDFDSAATLGLPLRGSDKCHQESECLHPPTYIRLLGQIWLEKGFPQKLGNKQNSTANILVTSELENLVQETYAVSSNEDLVKQLPFKPRWITNTNDVRQANGNTGRPTLRKGVEEDDIITSILSTFKLQMNAAYTIGNCCSNFHQIIFHLLRGGCGVEPENKGMCIQDRNESLYQLCCDKKNGPVCPRQRLERLAVEFNRTSITVEEAEMKIWEAG